MNSGAPRPAVTPRSRRSWRQWLERHHAARTEVWVVFFKRHTGRRTLSYQDAVEEALCFGWIDGIKRSIDDDRYSHRFSPRQPDSKWSASNRARIARLEQQGLLSSAGRDAVERAKRNGTWNPPRATFDFRMPAELDARLRERADAARFFASLAPSYRREFIAWVGTAKRAETRERRADEAVELLARGERLGMR